MNAIHHDQHAHHTHPTRLTALAVNPTPPPPPPPHYRPTPLDRPDEAMYLRFCTRTRSLYSDLTPEGACSSAVQDLLNFGNAAHSRGDLDLVARLHYCFTRLSQDWDGYLARSARAPGGSTGGVA